MTERAWTRGPWKVAFTHWGEASVIVPDPSSGSLRNGEPVKYLCRGASFADAKLFAAAPDLFEALEALLTVVESEFQVERDERPDGSHIGASVRGYWLQARAALARARGETL